jgi:hypothetical protein
LPRLAPNRDLPDWHYEPGTGGSHLSSQLHRRQRDQEDAGSQIPVPQKTKPLLGLKQVIMKPPDHESVTLSEASSMHRPPLGFISIINQEVVCEELLFTQGVCSLTNVIMGN